MDRVELANEDCKIKADHRITLTISYSYVVNQKMHTGKISAFYSVLMLHCNSVNVPSIQNMKNVKKKYHIFSLLYLTDVV